MEGNEEPFDRGFIQGRLYAPSPYWLWGYTVGYWFGLFEKAWKLCQ